MKYLLIALFFSLSMISCGQTKGTQQNEEVMRYQPKEFIDVELNSSVQNKLSPEEGDLGWTGIKLNAPESVYVHEGDKDISIPICGIYSLLLSEIAKSENGLEIQVESIQLGKTYRGYMLDEDHGTEAPSPSDLEEDLPEEDEDMLLEAYFNPDIRDYVSFPLKEGEYKVSVVYGGLTSNTVHIQLVKE